MKINNQNPLRENKTKSHFSSEKIIVGVFASLSLAFALFYAFGQNSVNAGAVDLSAMTPVKISDVAATNPTETNATASVSDVVTKALAFKASLTTTQQATLEKTYTAALGRRWSNLPCGANCRNGIQFSTLTAAQQTLALQVIQAAAGTASNEGYDEFNQVRYADGFLNQSGGGSGYGAGIYFIAFLNTPTTTGGWMLQFGGHHYGANISYNQGHVVSATPQFEAVEPSTAFTYNGGTYQPLLTERTNMANMLASLTTAQLTTAKLSSTFSDCVMSPGESNGGTSTFPAIAQGLAVSTLSDAQKLLVLEAMKPWVKDADDTVAANLLTLYQNELNSTYISYTGNGTSGNASTFLNANTNYARISGPSVWIEFICQNGVVLSGIHYHTVYRDRQRDYGADLSLTVPLDTTAATVQSPYDFDGDSKTDIGIFRPSTGAWWINASSTNATTAAQFGESTDTIVPGDYMGDGKADIALFRPSNGYWYILRSSDSTFYGFQFGASGDVPASGDFDGDNKTDAAIFRPSAAAWYILRSSDNGVTAQAFGTSEDQPVVADYDGDGKDDIGIFRPSTSAWWIQRSSTNAVTAIQFGQTGDKTVQGDYTGDGKADIAFFRPSNGYWYILRSEDYSFYGFPFGASTDTPAPGDYDGDGKFDAAVFRSSNSAWYLNRSTSGSLAVQFGTTGDQPIPNAFVR